MKREKLTEKNSARAVWEKSHCDGETEEKRVCNRAIPTSKLVNIIKDRVNTNQVNAAIANFCAAKSPEMSEYYLKNNSRPF